MSSKTVRLDGRRFVVSFGDDGLPKRIGERKVFNKGHAYLEHIGHQWFWHHKHHAPRGRLVSRILEALDEPAH